MAIRFVFGLLKAIVKVYVGIIVTVFAVLLDTTC